MCGNPTFDVGEVPESLRDCFEEIEVQCGAPWRRVVEHNKGDNESTDRPKRTAGMDSTTSTLSLSGNGSVEWAKRGGKSRTIGWEPGCTCPLKQLSGIEERLPSHLKNPFRTHWDVRPCVVLDPFAGSGTTLLVARQMGRNSIGIDLSPEYCEMAWRRIHNPEPEAAVADVPGQLEMF